MIKITPDTMFSIIVVKNSIAVVLSFYDAIFL